MPGNKRILLVGVISAAIILLILGLHLIPAKATISVAAGKQGMAAIVRDGEDEFRALYPDLQISLSETDLRDALTALRQGKIDVALGRDVREPGDPGLLDLSSLREYPVARHGVVIVANEQTPGTALSVVDLGKIFRKEVRNWKELGGSDMPIVLVGAHQSLSRSIFQSLVLGDGRSRFQPDIGAADDRAVLGIVATNPGAIGITNFRQALSQKGARLEPVHVLPIVSAGTPVEPTKASLLDGTYPLYGNLSAYTREDCPDPARRFIGFLRSPEGMTIIEENKEIALFDEGTMLDRNLGTATVIHFPGLYRLARDLKGCPKSSCIRILSSDVVLDGMGHTLSGSGGPRANGIEVGQEYVPVSNVTIRNLTVRKFNRGIFAVRARDLTLDSVRATENRHEVKLFRLPDPSYDIHTLAYGLHLMNSSDITITRSTFSENGDKGMFIQYTCNLTIEGNALANNVRDGVHLMYGKETCPGTSGFSSRIVGNTFSMNGRMGINAQSMRFIRIHGNNLRNNAYMGIYLYQSRDIIVTGNIIEGSRLRNDYQGKYYQGMNITWAGNRETLGTQWIATNLSILFLTLFLAGQRFILRFVVKPVLDRVHARGSRWWPTPFASLPAAERIARYTALFHHSAVTSAIAAVTLGLSFYLTKPHLDDPLSTMAFFLLLGLIVSVVPKISQSLFARRYGIISTFRLWWTGILLLFLSSVVIQAVLGVTFVYGRPLRSDPPDAADKRRSALISLSGIISLLLVTACFFCLSYISTDRLIQYIAITGVEMGVLSSVIGLLPFSPMDGERVKAWNRAVWAALFLPLFALYLAQFIFYEMFMYYL